MGLRLHILLVHVDGKLPNLVLMKASAYHKRKGDIVQLRRMRRGSIPFPHVNPDLVYIACVFSWNRPKALALSKMFKCEVRLGGIGFDSELPDEIEHIMPDYSLYRIDYSVGFTSRGCIRKCPWCVVPQKEGHIRDHAPVSEFWNPQHRKLILLDNNILASPKWKENFEFIIVNRLEVNILQGLDIRLVNDETTKWLTLLRSETQSFSGRDMLHFAFDDIRYEKEVRKGIETMKNHGIRPSSQTFFFLCGFKEPTFQPEDMTRFKILRELGVNPFVMIYRDPNKTTFKVDPLLKHFANWVNKPGRYKACKFSEFSRLSKEEKARLRAMDIT